MEDMEKALSIKTEEVYKPGDIVWIKVTGGNGIWWPAMVMDKGTLDPEVTGGLKITPLVVVKYLNEDTYDFVRSYDHIFVYNCKRKEEFLKIGFKKFYKMKNEKNVAKFPEDVREAEKLTNGNPDIVDDPKYKPPEAQEPVKSQNGGRKSLPASFKGKISSKLKKSYPFLKGHKHTNDADGPSRTERPPIVKQGPTWYPYEQFINLDLSKNRRPPSEDPSAEKEEWHICNMPNCGFKSTSRELKMLHYLYRQCKPSSTSGKFQWENPMNNVMRTKIKKTSVRPKKDTPKTAEKRSAKKKKKELPPVPVGEFTPPKKSRMSLPETPNSLEVSQECAKIIEEWTDDEEADESTLDKINDSATNNSMLTEEPEEFDEQPIAKTTPHKADKPSDAPKSSSCFDFDDEEPAQPGLQSSGKFGQIRLPRVITPEKSKPPDPLDDGNDIDSLLNEVSVPEIPSLPPSKQESPFSRGDRTYGSSPFKDSKKPAVASPVKSDSGDVKADNENNQNEEKHFLAEGPLQSKKRRSSGLTEGAEDGSVGIKRLKVGASPKKPSNEEVDATGESGKASEDMAKHSLAYTLADSSKPDEVEDKNYAAEIANNANSVKMTANDVVVDNSGESPCKLITTEDLPKVNAKRRSSRHSAPFESNEAKIIVGREHSSDSKVSAGSLRTQEGLSEIPTIVPTAKETDEGGATVDTPQDNLRQASQMPSKVIPQDVVAPVKSEDSAQPSEELKASDGTPKGNRRSARNQPQELTETSKREASPELPATPRSTRRSKRFKSSDETREPVAVATDDSTMEPSGLPSDAALSETETLSLVEKTLESGTKSKKRESLQEVDHDIRVPKTPSTTSSKVVEAVLQSPRTSKRSTKHGSAEPTVMTEDARPESAQGVQRDLDGSKSPSKSSPVVEEIRKSSRRSQRNRSQEVPVSIPLPEECLSKSPAGPPSVEASSTPVSQSAVSAVTSSRRSKRINSQEVTVSIPLPKCDLLNNTSKTPLGLPKSLKSPIKDDSPCVQSLHDTSLSDTLPGVNSEHFSSPPGVTVTHQVTEENVAEDEGAASGFVTPDELVTSPAQTAVVSKASEKQRPSNRKQKSPNEVHEGKPGVVETKGEATPKLHEEGSKHSKDSTELEPKTTEKRRSSERKQKSTIEVPEAKYAVVETRVEATPEIPAERSKHSKDSTELEPKAKEKQRSSGRKQKSSIEVPEVKPPLVEIKGEVAPELQKEGSGQSEDVTNLEPKSTEKQRSIKRKPSNEVPEAKPALLEIKGEVALELQEEGSELSEDVIELEHKSTEKQRSSKRKPKPSNEVPDAKPALLEIKGEVALELQKQGSGQSKDVRDLVSKSTEKQRSSKRKQKPSNEVPEEKPAVVEAKGEVTPVHKKVGSEQSEHVTELEPKAIEKERSSEGKQKPSIEVPDVEPAAVESMGEVTPALQREESKQTMDATELEPIADVKIQPQVEEPGENEAMLSVETVDTFAPALRAPEGSAPMSDNCLSEASSKDVAVHSEADERSMANEVLTPPAAVSIHAQDDNELSKLPGDAPTAEVCQKDVPKVGEPNLNAEEYRVIENDKCVAEEPLAMISGDAPKVVEATSEKTKSSYTRESRSTSKDSSKERSREGKPLRESRRSKKEPEEIQKPKKDKEESGAQREKHKEESASPTDDSGITEKLEPHLEKVLNDADSPSKSAAAKPLPGSPKKRKSKWDEAPTLEKPEDLHDAVKKAESDVDNIAQVPPPLSSSPEINAFNNKNEIVVETDLHVPTVKKQMTHSPSKTFRQDEAATLLEELLGSSPKSSPSSSPKKTKPVSPVQAAPDGAGPVADIKFSLSPSKVLGVGSPIKMDSGVSDNALLTLSNTPVAPVRLSRWDSLVPGKSTAASPAKSPQSPGRKVKSEILFGSSKSCMKSSPTERKIPDVPPKLPPSIEPDSSNQSDDELSALRAEILSYSAIDQAKAQAAEDTKCGSDEILNSVNSTKARGASSAESLGQDKVQTLLSPAKMLQACLPPQPATPSKSPGLSEADLLASLGGDAICFPLDEPVPAESTPRVTVGSVTSETIPKTKPSDTPILITVPSDSTQTTGSACKIVGTEKEAMGNGLAQFGSGTDLWDINSIPIIMPEDLVQGESVLSYPNEIVTGTGAGRGTASTICVTATETVSSIPDVTVPVTPKTADSTFGQVQSSLASIPAVDSIPLPPEPEVEEAVKDEFIETEIVTDMDQAEIEQQVSETTPEEKFQQALVKMPWLRPDLLENMTKGAEEKKVFEAGKVTQLVISLYDEDHPDYSYYMSLPPCKVGTCSFVKSWSATGPSKSTEIPSSTTPSKAISKPNSQKMSTTNSSLVRQVLNVNKSKSIVTVARSEKPGEIVVADSSKPVIVGTQSLTVPLNAVRPGGTSPVKTAGTIMKQQLLQLIEKAQSGELDAETARKLTAITSNPDLMAKLNKQQKVVVSRPGDVRAQPIAPKTPIVRASPTTKLVSNVSGVPVVVSQAKPIVVATVGSPGTPAKPNVLSAATRGEPLKFKMESKFKNIQISGNTPRYVVACDPVTGAPAVKQQIVINRSAVVAAASRSVPSTVQNVNVVKSSVPTQAILVSSAMAVPSKGQTVTVVSPVVTGTNKGQTMNVVSSSVAGLSKGQTVTVVSPSVTAASKGQALNVVSAASSGFKVVSTTPRPRIVQRKTVLPGTTVLPTVTTATKLPQPVRVRKQVLPQTQTVRTTKPETLTYVTITNNVVLPTSSEQLFVVNKPKPAVAPGSDTLAQALADTGILDGETETFDTPSSDLFNPASVVIAGSLGADQLSTMSFDPAGTDGVNR